MSDAVWLALIAMVQSWGDKLITNLSVIVPAVGTALIAWMTWRNNQRSVERAERVKERIAEAAEAAKRTQEEAALMAKGAERRGFEGGIATERNRASDLGALKASFNPESTDVFMKK